MKFKCINNGGHEGYLTLGRIYDGEYSSELNYDGRNGRKQITIFSDDKGERFTYYNFRFEIVLEAC